ncbi:hypothetical protein GCM10025787_29930 [Saccharopolyspora rosea]
MNDVDDELDPVALTGRVTAALRARESARPDRLFDDPFAARLAGARGRELVAAFDGDNQVIAVRTRLVDDEFARRTDEFDQFAILAAGMDTRAYRLAFHAGTAVFEVDRPEVLALKERLLTAPPDPAPAPRCDRRTVGADLGADWSAPLRAAGFRPDRPTCTACSTRSPRSPHPEATCWSTSSGSPFWTVRRCARCSRAWPSAAWPGGTAPTIRRNCSPGAAGPPRCGGTARPPPAWGVRSTPTRVRATSSGRAARPPTAWDERWHPSVRWDAW